MGAALPITRNMTESASVGFPSRLGYVKLPSVDEVMTRPEPEKMSSPRPSDAPAQDAPVPPSQPLDTDQLDLSENLQSSPRSRWRLALALTLIYLGATAVLVTALLWLLVW